MTTTEAASASTLLAPMRATDTAGRVFPQAPELRLQLRGLGRPLGFQSRGLLRAGPQELGGPQLLGLARAGRFQRRGVLRAQALELEAQRRETAAVRQELEETRAQLMSARRRAGEA